VKVSKQDEMEHEYIIRTMSMSSKNKRGRVAKERMGHERTQKEGTNTRTLESKSYEEDVHTAGRMDESEWGYRWGLFRSSSRT
jgi:hypothetical protein